MERQERPQTVAAVRPHRLQLEDRRQLVLTGVSEVTAYDAYSATLETDCGTLVVGGTDIRVKNFSAESGEARIEGEVEYLQYQSRGRAGQGEGLLRRLFR